MVILGSGYDTRAYTRDSLKNVTLFEIDMKEV